MLAVLITRHVARPFSKTIKLHQMLGVFIRAERKLQTYVVRNECFLLTSNLFINSEKMPKKLSVLVDLPSSPK